MARQLLIACNPLNSEPIDLIKFGHTERLPFCSFQTRVSRSMRPYTIPERSDQRARRATRPSRPLTFDQAAGKSRDVVERAINRL